MRYLLLPVIMATVAVSCKNVEKQEEMTNPFFSEYRTPFDLPPFEKIQAGHYMPAFQKGLEEARKDLEAIVTDKESPTFGNTVETLDKMGKLLQKVSYVFFAQASANTNDSIQKIEVEISPLLSAFQDEIRLNPVLFGRIKSVYDNREKLNLNEEQKFLLENLYKNFVRNGASLSKRDQDSLKVLNQKLSVLTVKFSQNILSETNNYKMVITSPEELAGLPEALVSAAALEAKNQGLEGKWVFTTKKPSIFPFLTYSENRERRKELFTAYTMRGNNGNEFDNNEILSEIVKLRAERAKLLGYKNHSSFVLEQAMAKTPENVFNLLDNLWGRSIKVAIRERDELQRIAEAEGSKIKIEPWDWWYYAEKVRKTKYDLDESELRTYFSLENVLDGALEVANRLYNITFNRLGNVPLPHPDALAYEVKERDGSHIGVLYFDFYPRESKQQGGWCGTYRSHYIEKGKEIKPVVTTVFNFTAPSNDMPALLNLDEVTTLFHEFGHALEFLFNKATYNTTFTAQDFVELPSQIMEHWATEPEVLKVYARHFKTGEIMPDPLIEKIKNSKYFNQGFETTELLAASYLDMAYHTLVAPVDINIQEFEKEYFRKIGLIPEIVSRYRSTYFLHIVDGYDSGYYGYTWAAVLDNDAYEKFREKGIFDSATAELFRKSVLEKDGTMDPMQMYINFRGREPSIEPLLKNRGLI